MPDVNAIKEAAQFLIENKDRSIVYRDQIRFSILGYPCASKTVRGVIQMLSLIPIEGFKVNMNLVPGSTAYIFKDDFKKYNPISFNLIDEIIFVH